jgi:hypothetical protein
MRRGRVGEREGEREGGGEAHKRKLMNATKPVWKQRYVNSSFD